MFRLLMRFLALGGFWLVLRRKRYSRPLRVVRRVKR